MIEEDILCFRDQHNVECPAIADDGARCYTLESCFAIASLNILDEIPLEMSTALALCARDPRLGNTRITEAVRNGSRADRGYLANTPYPDVIRTDR